MKKFFPSTFIAYALFFFTTSLLQASVEENATGEPNALQTKLARTPPNQNSTRHQRSPSTQKTAPPSMTNPLVVNSTAQTPDFKQKPKTPDIPPAAQEPKANDNTSSSKTQPSQKQSVETSDVHVKAPVRPVTAQAKFEPFTGKIKGTRVRVRLQPNLEGAVLDELNPDELVVVDSESEDYYAIQPPADAKAYVYRTYVLDNVIEGNRVNARLHPDLEAPIVAQFNSGDRVEGSIAQDNHKWLEIKLPATTRFYVAKDYVEKAGDVGLKARLEKKHEEGIQMLRRTEGVAIAEMRKPFEQIDMENVKTAYHHLINDYPEFPEVGQQSKDALTAFLEQYANKKLAYLENQTRNSSKALEANKQLTAQLQAQKDQIHQLQDKLEENKQTASISEGAPSAQPRSYQAEQLPVHMADWIPLEEKIIEKWAEQTGNHSPSDFYEDQKKHGFILKGVVEAYSRPVKNKPGDFMLLNSSSKLPIAFLYSTTVNLQDYVGHEVSVRVVPRANNRFAFPAYYVLQLE